MAYISFPAARRVNLYSTNPPQRLNGKVKRRTKVVGIFPDGDAITRTLGAILLEQNDEWAVQHGRGRPHSATSRGGTRSKVIN
ncbi:transposase-like protein [Bradyrhizobium sp. USDA 4353]